MNLNILIQCKNLPDKSKEIRLYNLTNHTFGENLKYCLFSNKLYPNIHKDLKREVVKKNFTSSFKKTPLESSFFFVFWLLFFLSIILLQMKDKEELLRGYRIDMSPDETEQFYNNFPLGKKIDLVIKIINLLIPFFPLWIFLKEQIKGVKNYLIFFSIILTCFLLQYTDKLINYLKSNAFFYIAFSLLGCLCLFFLIIFTYHILLLSFALFQFKKSFLVWLFIAGVIIGFIAILLKMVFFMPYTQEDGQNYKSANGITYIITFFIGFFFTLLMFIFIYAIFSLDLNFFIAFPILLSNKKYRNLTFMLILSFLFLIFFGNIFINIFSNQNPLISKNIYKNFF